MSGLGKTWRSDGGLMCEREAGRKGVRERMQEWVTRVCAGEGEGESEREREERRERAHEREERERERERRGG